MIKINQNISIDENNIKYDFVRSSGPGGQNVNKVATAVQLRYDLENSVLPEEIKTRLLKLAGNRVNKENVLVIEAKQYRTQEKNRNDALDRLIKLIKKASVKPKKRKRTKPTKESQEKRLEEKKRRSEIKKLRKL
jgi:ribosome-associated protein